MTSNLISAFKPQYIIRVVQLLFNSGVTHSLTDNVTFSCFGHVSVVVERFGLSLRVCHLKVHNEAILDSCRGENVRYRREVLN